MQINRENQQRARAARTDHLLKAPEVKLPMKRNREEISLENEDDDFDKETAVDSEDSEDSAKEKKAANLAAAVTDALFAEQTAKIEAEANQNQDQNQDQNGGNSGNSGNSGNEDEEAAGTSLTAEEKDKIEME